jgi:hypothetical protein
MGYNTSPIEEVAANFYGVGSAGRGNPPKQVLGQVTRCVVAGDPTVFFNYAQGKQVGYLVLLIHDHLLYGLTLEGVAGVDQRAWQDAKRILGSWTWTVTNAPTPPAIGSCIDQPSGPASAPLRDNFKVVVRIPDGWTAEPPTENAYETRMLVLDAPSRYGNQPTKIYLHSFVGGAYSSGTIEQIAARYYGSSGSRELVGQVTWCAAGGDPAVFFKYTDGQHAGYIVMFLHYHNYLYGIQLEGVGGVDPRSWEDAKKVLGSWTWTVTTDARCTNGAAGTWRTYTSPKWGYSVDYPPDWCNLPDYGPPDIHKYFATESVGSPLEMSNSGIWLTLQVASGTCQATRGFKEIYDQSMLKVSGQNVTRTYGYYDPGATETAFMVHAAIASGSNCYTLAFVTQARLVADKNLATLDRIITSFRFA